MYHPSSVDRFLLGLAHVLEIGNWLITAFAVLALFPTVIQRAFFTVFALRGSWFSSIYGWSLSASSLGEVNEVQRVVCLIAILVIGVLFAMACHYTVALLSYAGPLFRHDDEDSPEQQDVTPFTESNVRNIRHVANYLLAIGVIQSVFEFLIGLSEAAFGSMMHGPLGEGITAEQIPNPIPRLEGNNMDIVVILVAVLVFCIARMFEYGVKLQEADDELI